MNFVVRVMSGLLGGRSENRAPQERLGSDPIPFHRLSRASVSWSARPGGARRRHWMKARAVHLRGYPGRIKSSRSAGWRRRL